MAGHGVGINDGADTYLYLTQEARSNDRGTYSDPAVRAQSTVSSNELVEWTKQIPALKQVMILDTCAAGAAAAQLVEKREGVSGDQIRAIERLKDRTGFHVLMGSAADAVSYESSQYGQGLLTYALLRGMRGEALRDGEYLDVQRLFQYAADKVPELAKNLGGIQRPVVAAPRGTSFDVGRLGAEDRPLIPLAVARPLVLRPMLMNPAEGDDTLHLIGELRRRLREEDYIASRGGAAQSLVFVDEDDLPGAIRPTGTYTVEGDVVKVRLLLRRDDKTVAALPVLEGRKVDIPGLVDRMMAAIQQAMSRNDISNDGAKPPSPPTPF